MTVLQRRTLHQPSVNFNRTWHDYETGFGNDGNIWIGLKGVHRLSSRGRNLLTIEIIDMHGMTAGEQYAGFWVDDASSHYTMYAGLSHEGSKNSLEPADSRPFTAPDGGRDGCANEFESGWWFPSSCRRTLINLNGRHNSTGPHKIFAHNMTVKYAQMTVIQTFLRCDKTCPNGGTCRKSSTGDSYVCVHLVNNSNAVINMFLTFMTVWPFDDILQTYWVHVVVTIETVHAIVLKPFLWTTKHVSCQTIVDLLQNTLE